MITNTVPIVKLKSHVLQNQNHLDMHFIGERKRSYFDPSFLLTDMRSGVKSVT